MMINTFYWKTWTSHRLWLENDSRSFSASTASCQSSPCNTADFVAMKHRDCGTNIEETGKQAEVVAEQSSVGSSGSLITGICSSNTTSSISSNTMMHPTRKDCTSPELIKKAKPLKHPRKGVPFPIRTINSSLWGQPFKAETLQYFSQQYSPMYSMMFSHLTPKHFTEESNDSEEEQDEEDACDSDGGEADDHSSHSSTIERSSPRAVIGGRMGYECGECGLVAETRPGLKKHIVVCHPSPAADAALLHKLPHMCPMASCHFHTMERDEMEAHVAEHVAEGYSPTGKKKVGPLSLQRVRYEREEYHCHVCTYTCTIEKAFYKHLKLHTLGLNVGGVKISCVVCGKDRPSEVDMSKHMRKHRDNRYFCCDICIFRTVQLKKLIQHRRMHTGEKPHLCPHCTYRSARRDNLRSHVRRVHKKENLYCDTFSPRGLLLSAGTSQPQEESSNPSPSQE